jgi:hypothetical protein
MSNLSVRSNAILIAALLSNVGLVFANQAHDTLAGMSEDQRAGAMRTFMERSGEACPSVTRTFFQGFDKERSAFWNVQCSNRKAFVVMIYNDARGSNKILECGVLKAVTGMQCFKKF